MQDFVSEIRKIPDKLPGNGLQDKVSQRAYLNLRKSPHPQCTLNQISQKWRFLV